MAATGTSRAGSMTGLITTITTTTTMSPPPEVAALDTPVGSQFKPQDSTRKQLAWIMIARQGRILLLLLQRGVAAHSPKAYMAHSRFDLTTVAYSLGKFLTNTAQHRSYPRSVWYGRAVIRTDSPMIVYLV